MIIEPDTGIYYILNTINNKIYVGQSERVGNRFKQHKQALRSNRHNNALLQADWNYYGERAFEFGILTMVTGNKHYSRMNELENTFIRVYQSENPELGYNVNLRAAQERAKALRAASK